jgi:hypothetical protein
MPFILGAPPTHVAFGRCHSGLYRVCDVPKVMKEPTLEPVGSLMNLNAIGF